MDVMKAYQLMDEGKSDEARLLLLDALADPAADASHRRAMLMALGYAASALYRYDEARVSCRELAEMADTVKDRHIALHQLGMVERLAGEYSQAMALFEQEHSMISPQDEMALSANAYERAWLSMKMNDLPAAETIAQKALRHAEATGDDMCVACAWRCIGEIAAARGCPEAAVSAWQRSRAAFLRAEDTIGADEVADMLQRFGSPDESNIHE